MKRTLAGLILLALVPLLLQRATHAQQSSVLRINAVSNEALRQWDAYVTQRERSGELRVRTVDRDPSVPSHTVERFQQYHEGVPVWGAEVVRDSERGVPLSIFGSLSPDLALSVEPSLSVEAARAALLAIGASDAALLKEPQLVILRLETSGEHRLAYTAPLFGNSDVVRVFIDAGTGMELLRFSEIETQAAVGTGRGVLGDNKKLSVLGRTGVYVADDQHRPPVLTTFDMLGNLSRAKNVLNGAALVASDVASDTDNVWTDPAVVDAHVHVGWTYDYYFKRFGRRGLDNRDRSIVTLTNGVTQQGALSLPAADAFIFAVNAFWCDVCGPGGSGAIYFGNGIPAGVFLIVNGRNYTYFSGALDIVAHELTHGVTSSSSRLIYQGESGALNEAFSDIMGKSVEFFYHAAGNGVGQADYVLGKDISRAVRAGSLNGDRSMANPALYGDPDHYSRRYTGTADNGGVHTNSGIANQAFYLAIEGGANRTSGATVQGVGAANREQIEKVYYRAFVFLMPANSTFSTARAATTRAAQDLYGAGGAVERAVTQAWTAVGVF